jgi:hypothetical protein
MSKKPKTYNLSKEVRDAVSERALSDGRKDSDWLNRYLTKQLLSNKPKTKTEVAEVKFNFKAELLALGVGEEVLSDWLKVRAKKKASNTKTALKGLIAEVTKSGLMLNDAIEFAASKSWSGFKADWYFKEQPNTQSKQFSKTTEQNINNIGEWLNE